MFDFEIQRSTRRCCKTDREFRPGEIFFSQLRTEDGEIVRQDFSSQAWSETAKDAIGWWQCRMPDDDDSRARLAPNDVMLQYFEQLENDPRRADVRYVLALLLTRRRILRIEDTNTDDQGRETMIMSCSRNENEYCVLVAEPEQDRIEPVQEELAKMLFARAA